MSLKRKQVDYCPSIEPFGDNCSKIRATYGSHPLSELSDESFEIMPTVLTADGDETSSSCSSVKADYNPLDFGSASCVCCFCGAFYWFAERSEKNSRKDAPRYNLCCREGRVSLPLLKEPPVFLKRLLNSKNGEDAVHFLKYIRRYNNCNAMTSMGVKIDNSVNRGQGNYVFKINGEAHHLMGSLLPAEGELPKFAQLYVYDTQNEISNRMVHLLRNCTDEGPKFHIVAGLRDMFNEHNVVVKAFRTAAERIITLSNDGFRLRICADRTNSDRQYSAPAVDEVVGLIVGDIDPRQHKRDIIVEHRTNHLQRISTVHPLYMALQYPVMFPYGEDSYHPTIPYNIHSPGASNVQRGFVTMLEFYRRMFHVRHGEAMTVFQCGRLFQQVCVDVFASIEQIRLHELYKKQEKMRCESLANIRTVVTEGDMYGSEVGQRIILSSKHLGSPRYLFQNYQDAVAICRRLGHPHLFITFTCNPAWPEIKRTLLPGQSAVDRPDLICRIFKMRLHELIDDIKEKNFFGPVAGLVYTVEFQKRGYPHVHIIVWLFDKHSLTTAEEIDQYISAELPDPLIDRKGHDAVSKFMMHGPCGAASSKAACMVDGVCTKNYPKDFECGTTISDDGFILYRRKRNGITTEKGNVILDNRSVVPYNLELLLKHQSHLNIERCHSALVIKYLFKYICKGTDRTLASIEREASVSTGGAKSGNKTMNEIAQYLDCRYLTAPESIWRIFEYDVHYSNPSMERLPIHLPFENNVIFHDGQLMRNIANNETYERTKLTEWFMLNQINPVARQYTYAELPEHFTWQAKLKCWTVRMKGNRMGRMYYVHPSSGELYYLRMLLNTRKGALSFEDLRTVNGVIYGTFKETCYALGLLEDDNEALFALQEVAAAATAKQLRILFVTMLLHSQVSSPIDVWNQCWRLLGEDSVNRIRKRYAVPQFNLTDNMIKDDVLYELQDLLATRDCTLQAFGLPIPLTARLSENPNKLIAEQLSFNTVHLRQAARHLVQTLNDDQRVVYDNVLASVNENLGKLFFVYGHGGTGKTHLWQTITSTIRAEGNVVLTVASSGIASLLLQGGCTAYSRFKIPIELNEESTCSIKKGTHLAELLKRAVLIIWDEAPMSNRICFEALNRTMNDIFDIDVLSNPKITFGGKTVVLGGDFRQTLPVIQRGSRYDTINASIVTSPLWQRCHLFRLTINMRVLASLTNHAEKVVADGFAKWVLAVGDGSLHVVESTDDESADLITIPDDLILDTANSEVDAIIDAIYPNLEEEHLDLQYLEERAIVAPKNIAVNKLNETILKRVPGIGCEYFSVDSIDNSESIIASVQATYPVEFLNTITSGSLPCHKLVLKVGVPIMLLRNLDRPNGLCNGTRLLVTELRNKCIQAQIITGTAAGNIVHIPRIIFVHSANDLPFKLRRKQFPVRLAYAMTINKSQGQSLQTIGVYLHEPVFAHGQLYVAFSRATSRNGLKILISNKEGKKQTRTKNIVYREIFSFLECAFNLPKRGVLHG